MSDSNYKNYKLNWLIVGVNIEPYEENNFMDYIKKFNILDQIVCTMGKISKGDIVICSADELWGNKNNQLKVLQS